MIDVGIELVIDHRPNGGQTAVVWLLSLVAAWRMDTYVIVNKILIDWKTKQQYFAIITKTIIPLIKTTTKYL